MKTQETLSFRNTPQFSTVPLKFEDLSSDRFAQDNKQDAWSVHVRTKEIGSARRSPRIGHIPTRRGAPPSQSPHRWGLLLAGGDGVRLRELTRWVCGDDRPKQFCPLLDDRTLLETTRQRAERSLLADHIVIALTRTHQEYYRDLVDPSLTTIVQPFNRGTAPAILYGLMHIARQDPDAVVSILPSDHYYSPEAGFTNTLETALEVAEQRPDSVVLLGAPANGPEVDYGWIEVGQAVTGYSGLFRVRGFREKPPRPVAETLYRNGSLWNMFVLVGRVRAFLEIATRTAQDVLRALESHASNALRGPAIEIPDSVYENLSPVDFSTRVLSSDTGRLLALRLDNVEWNDLGDPYRVLVTLVERNGELPAWAKLWPDSGDEPRAVAAHA